MESPSGPIPDRRICGMVRGVVHLNVFRFHRWRFTLPFGGGRPHTGDATESKMSEMPGSASECQSQAMLQVWTRLAVRGYDGDENMKQVGWRKVGRGLLSVNRRRTTCSSRRRGHIGFPDFTLTRPPPLLSFSVQRLNIIGINGDDHIRVSAKLSSAV